MPATFFPKYTFGKMLMYNPSLQKQQFGCITADEAYSLVSAYSAHDGAEARADGVTTDWLCIHILDALPADPLDNYMHLSGLVNGADRLISLPSSGYEKTAIPHCLQTLTRACTQTTGTETLFDILVPRETRGKRGSWVACQLVGVAGTTSTHLWGLQNPGPGVF